jgi:hypothetical protein
MKLPSLIFELGNLQVFHYQTQEEFMFNTGYKEVYWQDKASKNTYGPFKSVYDCMTHYTTTGASHKKGFEVLGVPVGTVIYIDFKNKKRIVYGEGI